MARDLDPTVDDVGGALGVVARNGRLCASLKLDVEVEQRRVRPDWSREAEGRACNQAAEGAGILEGRKGGGWVVGEAGVAFFVLGGKCYPGL
ncbi:hypothetical protein D3C86_1880740 [compost metagenome]